MNDPGKMTNCILAIFAAVRMHSARTIQRCFCLIQSFLSFVQIEMNMLKITLSLLCVALARLYAFCDELSERDERSRRNAKEVWGSPVQEPVGKPRPT